MRLPGKGFAWKGFLRELWSEWARNRLDDTAGMLAFSGILALFPFLLFAVSFVSLFIDPRAESELIDQIQRLVPREVADILGERVHALAGGKSPTLTTLSALGAIWAASGGIVALMRALDAAYGVEESRPFWKVRGLGLLMTIAGAVLVLVASVIAIGTPAIAHAVGEPIGTLLAWLRIPVSALFMMLMLATLYYVLPDVEHDFRFITLGSIVAVLIWIAASLGFSLYVNHFGSYEISYGALGSVIVLLLWMWISSMAVLLGAQINAIIEHRSPEGRRRRAAPLADKGADESTETTPARPEEALSARPQEAPPARP